MATDDYSSVSVYLSIIISHYTIKAQKNLVLKITSKTKKIVNVF